MLLVDFKLLLSSPPSWIRTCILYMNSCTVAFPPVSPSFKTIWENTRCCQLKARRRCVLPFTVRGVSVGVGGLSGVPEEAAAVPGPTDAVQAAPGPRWAGVPAVLHGGADEHRVALREDAFSVAITPAGGQQPGNYKGRVSEWALVANGYKQFSQGKEGLCWHSGSAA